jgi:hypothetical protein
VHELQELLQAELRKSRNVITPYLASFAMEIPADIAEVPGAAVSCLFSFPTGSHVAAQQLL